jgi:chemotaxis protein MotA
VFEQTIDQIMFAFIGIILVFAAVFGGYLLERGNPWVLIQPAEIIIVVGAAAGITLIANPTSVMRKMWRGSLLVFTRLPYTRQIYLVHLRMLYEVFSFVQRAGVRAFEQDVEAPEQSRIFANYPAFLRETGTRDFICDSLRMLVVGATTPRELDHLMEMDIEVQRRGHEEPVGALSTMADALPGLGIVAAVLGVVITMQAIGGSPETVGEKVAAALVGTFLGILLCYGVVGPMASRLGNLGEAHAEFLQVLRTALVYFARGASPILAVEYARRSIPVELRPSFVEMESTLRRDAKIPMTPEQENAKANAGKKQAASA